MDSLVFWAIVTVFIRAIAIGLFVYVIVIQYQQFKVKTYLQPLKRSLFLVPVALIVTNFPQGVASWDRILQRPIPNYLVSLASVTNSLGLLLTAVLFLMIYNFKEQ